MSESQERMMAVVEPKHLDAVPGHHRQVGRRGHRHRRGHRRRPPRHHLARRDHRRRAAALGRPRRARLRPPAGPAGIPGRAHRPTARPTLAKPGRRRGAPRELLTLLGSPNLCDKSWVTDQYDRYVLGNTALAQPDDAGVVRVDEETGPRRRHLDRLQRPLRQARPVCRRAARARRGLPQRRDRRRGPARRHRLPQLRLAGGPGRDVAVPRGHPRHRRGLQVARHPRHRRQRVVLQPDRRRRDPPDTGHRRARRHGRRLRASRSGSAATTRIVYLLGTTRDELDGSEWAHVVHSTSVACRRRSTSRPSRRSAGSSSRPPAPVSSRRPTTCPRVASPSRSPRRACVTASA